MSRCLILKSKMCMYRKDPFDGESELLRVVSTTLNVTVSGKGINWRYRFSPLKKPASKMRATQGQRNGYSGSDSRVPKAIKQFRMVAYMV